MTHENPYRSPTSPSMQPWQAETGTDGLWRDGNLLVMRNQNPRFPQRCIKTNMPYAGPPTRLKLTWLENETLWVLLAGVIGRAAAMASDGKKIWVDLPISHAWLGSRACIPTSWHRCRIGRGEKRLVGKGSNSAFGILLRRDIDGNRNSEPDSPA